MHHFWFLQQNHYKCRYYLSKKGKVPPVKCVLSHVRLFATPQTAAYQAPLSMGFARQEYWSGVPLPSPRAKLPTAKSDQPSQLICRWWWWTSNIRKALNFNLQVMLSEHYLWGTEFWGGLLHSIIAVLTVDTTVQQCKFLKLRKHLKLTIPSLWHSQLTS